MVWGCAKEATGPSDKNSEGFRSTRQATARSPEENVERRNQEGPGHRRQDLDRFHLLNQGLRQDQEEKLSVKHGVQTPHKYATEVYNDGDIDIVICSPDA
ncbi:hypothetical protein TELCIR_16006 [Teladorsagia circumcincta]|uniref:Uncharacterized protein n=1 Tax=Teladorsagia circumcincta TaxID=45464 RepID=A0A2G9TYB9_TELCI|nr:hypothetical protein TELCIR_16006 [Teladorsagia circumcincta]